MKIVRSRPPADSHPRSDPHIQQIADAVSEDYLRGCVEKIAVPRHAVFEEEANRAAGKWISDEFRRFGLNTFEQGKYGNVVGMVGEDFTRVQVLVGAHFDTVPRSPGADDNGSAVAAMLCAASILTEIAEGQVAFIAFNREEDGLLGSDDFVRNFLGKRKHGLQLVHVLEMVGYCDETPGSQQAPPGMPVRLGDTGNFIGMLSNRHSNDLVTSVLEVGSMVVPALPIVGLKIFAGVERLFPHLLRSDHSPFWSAGIPALMWTDTAEFRNPNYHLPSDLPDTLDYGFLARFTQLLVAQICAFLQLRDR